MNILLSAYACEPDRGSEPGLGWSLAISLARECCVDVVTRANNRESIEQALRNIAPEHRPRFHYHDLGAKWLSLKKRGISHRWYYAAWQRSLRPIVRDIVRNQSIDLIHHVTFASYRYPTGITGHNVPCLWGPVGGYEQTPWNLMPWRYPRYLVYEALRNIANFLVGKCSNWKKILNGYSKVLVSTHETQAFIEKAGLKTDLIPAIGIDEQLVPSPRYFFSELSPLRILYVGTLEYLKGGHFAVRAVAESGSPVHFSIVGEGSFEKHLVSIADKYSVSDKVSFLGQKNRADLKKIYAEHDIMIFPSLHDSGGMAVLEAMAASLPVIALKCGGPAIAVDQECGVLVPLGSTDQIISGITKAIRMYSSDRNLLKQHGIAARKKALSTYSWPIKIEKLKQIYSTILQHTPQQTKNSASA